VIHNFRRVSVNVQQKLIQWVKQHSPKLGLSAAALVMVGAGFVSATPSSTGLVAHWSYDQSTGTTLTDDSGNGHTGTFASTPTWAAGKINNGLTLNGTDNVAIGNITQINGASQVTLTTWIKRAANGAAVLVGKQASKQDFGIEAYGDGKVYFDISKGADTYGTVTLNDTAWHHVALVFDGTQTGNANRLKAYVDGVQKTLAFSGTVGTSTSTSTTPFNIGKMSSEYSNGQVDDTWLYTRALSASEVQDLMQSGQAQLDILAPSIPANLSATVVSQSQINLAWTASTDNVGVTGYRIYRDGAAVGTATGTTYQDKNLAAGTAHTYTVRAYDAAGNQSADSNAVSATTQAPDTTAPTVSLSAPSDASTVSNVVSVSADATDNVGVVGVKFYAGSTQIGSEDTVSPYTTSWDTATVANGSVQLTAVARDAAGNTTTSTAATVTVNNVAQTYKYVSGISSNGRYFVDQTGTPVLVKGDSPWAMFPDLSTAQVEQWAANREGHGFNSAIVSLIGGPGNGANTNGSTYDGILPFNSGNITSFNEAYWSRMDTDLTILKNHGITAFLYPMDGWNTLSGGAFYGKSAADSKTYGQMVATRYANYPNIVWMAGGDYNGYDSATNTEFTNMLAGIRSTGNSKPFSIQFNNESLSTDVSAYEPLASWNFAYTYSTTYQKILKSYERTATSRDPRPVLFGEGNYEGEDNYGGPATTNETLRRQQLWTLTSGAAGEFTGSQDWQFDSGWQNRLDTAWVTQAQKIRNFFSSLNWNLFIPDDQSPVVTAGRGTKITDDAYRDVLANDYVTAAQTPDKSQTIVYVPTSLSGTGTARTITLDQSKLPSSYTATWVDPTDATVSQAATIDSSGNVTTPGTHSDGTRDWLLLIH
jgi:chitodextrinase